MGKKVNLVVNKKKIIVTGGLGFIGSNLIELLLQKKFQVIQLSGIFINNSLQYHYPNNRGLGFFFDYRELFLDLVIPIIEDPLYLVCKKMNQD